MNLLQQKGGVSLGAGGQIGGGLTPGSGLGATQQNSSSGGLKLGMPTAAVAPQPSSSGVKLGLGQTGGLQLGTIGAGGGGGLKLGQTTQTTQIKAGLGLGGGGGGLQLGGIQNKGVQLGGLQTSTATAGLGTTGKGLQLGGGVGGGSGLGLKTGLPGPTSGLGITTTSVQTSAVPTTSFRGLGGVDPTAGKTSAGSSTPVMEQTLPPVLNQLVHEFSQHMKRQTTTGEEMNKFSDNEMKKVQQETVTQKVVVGEVLTRIQKDAQRVNFLKNENTETLGHVEIAQRTNELPAALQRENNAPAQYFLSIVTVFEDKMEMYRNQLMELESHLTAVCQDHTMSPQNLVDILQVQYRPFLLLAAQLQTIHEQLQVLKEHYLAYRRLFLQDSSNVFEERRKKREGVGDRGSVKTGPPPFSAAMGQATTALAAFSTTSALPGAGAGGTGGGGLRVGIGGTSGLTGLRGASGLGGGGGLGGGSGLGGGGLGGGLGGLNVGVGLAQQQNRGLTLGGLGASQPSLAGAGSTTGTIGQGFQLQRPPLGKKRGGNATT